MKRKFLFVIFLAVCVCLAGGCKKSRAKQQSSAQSQQEIVVPTATLHEAAASGNVSWMRILLEQGSDPNSRNEQGETPLLVAIKAGNARSVAFLLQNGADRGEVQPDGHPLWVEEAGIMTPEILRFMLPGNAAPADVYQALNVRGASAAGFCQTMFLAGRVAKHQPNGGGFFAYPQYFAGQRL